MSTSSWMSTPMLRMQQSPKKWWILSSTPSTILTRYGRKVNISLVKSCDSRYSQLFDDRCESHGVVARFWARAIRTASLPSQRHFLDSYTAYLRTIVFEARDREESRCRRIEDHLKLLRDTVAAKPAFAIYEMGMDLPDEVFNHPVTAALVECIT